MNAFIQGLPKVELHLHIEGSLEPELMFKLAKRNGIDIPYSSPSELRDAYQFEDLQSFLDLYYQGADALRTEQDFYDLTWEYLERCKADNVIHTEIFFDPQTHTDRGIDFDTVINGITRALDYGCEQLGITSQIIACFLRHLSEESAFETLQSVLKHKDKIIGVGLDSSEKGNPPAKFIHVFQQAKEAGLLTVAHAGEEGPAQNISDAIEMLEVSRVDHGVRCVEDEALVASLIESRMPLTVCPLSNIKLCVFENMKHHNVVDLLRKGVAVTINSDDPAYFGGYMTDNFLAVNQAHPMSYEELAKFTLNAIEASFIDEAMKANYRSQVQRYVDRHSAP
ncbi:Catalyzes the hydrolytic deamination of adenine to hypoxanthine. Plays an important role in the purine salvage pathway and in nitrogen catabolism [Vibrio sp. B1FLJ16]|uniref:adenosine deaminase n=1 Tax=Vibrio sp. B1FLJ16 TaxID=2751178 RepID=UPI0015F58814|nr:adenosine deaminase [Vibrio sp. B1FLJ16]CAD7823018.1 Catalyzes the hydrolytic deamination of adenine to hypoxanthine. Plays an important role in the purine salvage pathway and in nitrogen catabolism [Vibrio sp. B1FLJ16]CAE6950723.1 Catalyzes the hydrolytic deamination of adenine to hypoxanthine. Plays an important role in the purine salvage pathway and in nitrogen catabolism [Vibrio sp. B1FLJ16]